MKKLSFLSFVLCLLLIMLTASAETTLPTVGDILHGFTVLETKDFPLVNATIVRFVHNATGAELFYVANDDVNRAFDLTFRTAAVDSTGLPHVFEHATLNGSQKYPSASLFFNLSYQTYNTFMNALTYDVMTTYPVASLSEEQLLKLADFYTDSCFNPMVMTDESIFREEAWRYRLMGEDEPLTIEGTVYSEMLGATTLERKASKNALLDAFPGSVIGNDQGGDPDFIPDMTYESLRNYHNEYYHPSNCIAYLYGEISNLDGFLSILEEAFKPYEKESFRFEDSQYTPITEPVIASYPFPVEASSPTDHASTIYYTFVIHDENEEERMVLDTLTSLLSANSSNLSQTFRTALPYGSLSCYLEPAGPETAVVFTASNVNPDDTDTFKNTVDAAIAEVSENGFPQSLVESTMASLAIETKLIRENPNVGVDLIPSLAYYYVTSDNAYGYLDYADSLDLLDEWNKEGLFAQAAKKFLVSNVTTALTTTYPVPGLKEEKDTQLAARLAEIKAGMTPEEIAQLVAASNASVPEEDTTEMVASLSSVSVSTLPEEIKEYSIQDSTDEKGVRHVETLAGVDGVGEADILLDASGLSVSDLPYFQLLTSLVTYLDSTSHTRAELASLMERYLYSGSLKPSLIREDSERGCHLYYRMSWIAADEDLAAGYDLMRELAFELDLTNVSQLKEAVSALKTNLRTAITNSPYSVMLYRAAAIENPIYRLYSYLNFLDYYAFLEKAEETLNSDSDSFIAELTRVRDLLCNATNAISMYSGSEQGIEVNRPLADLFLSNPHHEVITPADYSELPVPDSREALIVDSAVQYNLLVASISQIGLDKFTGDIDALTNLVSDVFLYPLLRDQYGAYSVLHSASDEAGMYIVSYRDPNITETFDVYDNLSSLLSDYTVDQKTLDGYILSAYSRYALPTGELSGAVNAALQMLQGYDADRNLHYMRELKQLTPEAVSAYAAMYRNLAETGVRSTAGGAASINAHADLYNVILNPFGAVDSTSVTLSDVPEDSPAFDAIRFVFENGLMLPEGDAFMPEESATLRDLAGALYVLVGGPSGNPDEALAALSSYNLISSYTDENEPLTKGTLLTHFQTFCNNAMESNFPLELGEETDTIVSRADLASILSEFIQSLEE